MFNKHKDPEQQLRFELMLGKVNSVLNIVLWIALSIALLSILSFWNVYGKHKFDSVYYTNIGNEVVLGNNVTVTPNEDGTYSAKLFGVLPVGTLDIEYLERPVLGIGGGGVAISAAEDGVYVKAFSFENSKAEKAGIQLGDIIHSFNGHILTNDDWQLGDYVNYHGENTFILLRGAEKVTIKIALDGEDDLFGISYGLGKFVVGTVSFVDGNNFWAIGHSSGVSLKDATGVICNLGIIDGSVGVTGSQDNSFTVLDDTIYGIRGASEIEIEPNEIVEMAWAWEIQNGSGIAQIANLDVDDESWHYDEVPVNISKYAGSVMLADTGKSMSYKYCVESDDAEFLSGMSGSPVLQNGRFVGIIAAVDVSNPHRAFILTAEDAYVEYLECKKGD
mgnify:CR=1 FL=1